MRAIPVLRGGGLTGDLGYDDGAYYAAAVGFVHGLLPYRDFLFVQPPGIVLLLSPFAALGTLTSDATGMAVARATFILLGALNGVLVAVVAGRHRPRELLPARDDADQTRDDADQARIRLKTSSATIVRWIWLVPS